MGEVTGLAKRLATSWRGDVLLAGLTVACAVAYLAVIAGQGHQQWAAFIFVLPYATALAGRRRWPVPAAAVACAAMLAAWPLGLARTVSGPLTFPFFWTPFLIAYALGSFASSAAGLLGTVLLAIGLQAENRGFNPLLVMITVGPWLAGRIAQSRRHLTEQLQARNVELQAEQELFALESVRYERARIARELHDIVAHCLSVMVVQASAGQRVAADSAGVTEALESVAEAATQAQAEIGRLVELLGGDQPSGDSPRLHMLDELVLRAAATGLAVSLRFFGDCDDLAPAVSEAAYRVVQEALTNSLKHAPGARVDITIRGKSAWVEVLVENAEPRDRPSGLQRTGGSYGLEGMRERVTACGGQVIAGPTQAGGWHVLALLPVSSA